MSISSTAKITVTPEIDGGNWIIVQPAKNSNAYSPTKISSKYLLTIQILFTIPVNKVVSSIISINLTIMNLTFM